jgi:hypothetical protein
MWDRATGKPALPPLLHQAAVWHTAFSPDGRRILTACNDRTVRVWDAATGQPITPPLAHPTDVLVATFSPDGLHVYTVSADQTLRNWDLTPDDRPLEDELALAQLASGRRIDATGALIPLTAGEISQAWQRLRLRYPHDFTASAEQAFAWHRREMEDCLREGNPAAAVFHAWHAFPEIHLLWGVLRP